ncbi:MAG: site-2 protease family protein [Hadesarchaea archaeon]|nr:site-2 protease family protein [Hadesarchaea archaeon]
MGYPAAEFKCLACGHAEYRMSSRGIGELVLGECPKCGGDMAVISRELPAQLEELLNAVGERFEISDFTSDGARLEVEVAARDVKGSFRQLLRALEQKGYLAALRKKEGELRLLVMRRPRVGKENVLVNLALLLVTIVTTFLAGYFLFGRASHAWLFSAAIMLTLGAHELGHKIAAWRNRVEATMPYFIPGPSLLGTFGAFIRVKSPIPTKEALVEMGASGPALGFLVALPITFVGLMLSEPDPEAAPLLLTPIAFALLQRLAFGYLPAGVDLNPLAFAGWVVMVVTMFNLMPAGQLDGGHVARGLLDRERHRQLSVLLGLCLLLLGFIWPAFLIWGLLILFLFRGYHAGALDDVSELSSSHKGLAAGALVIFLLCLPLPVR